MSPKIALSTCWCSHRHKDGREMLEEIADLGFEYVELSHGIPISLVPGILQALEKGVIKVSSVHNFCPLPMGVRAAAPNLYEPTSPDQREQKQWLRYSRRTIEFAHQVKADYVVLHLGSVRFFWGDPQKTLQRHRNDKTAETLSQEKTYARRIERALSKVRKKMPGFLKTLRVSLEEIIPYAKEKGIRLGIENREGLSELPLDPDMAQFLDELPAPELIGYWHDTGHAQIKQQLDLIDHRQHLLENSKHLMGFHLHDVVEKGCDHQALGSGTIDFQMVQSFFRTEHVFVLEMNPRVEREAVVASRDYLFRLLDFVPN